MIEGMLYILRVACPWRALPEWYGPWSSVYSRWRRWNRSGLWARILKVVSKTPSPEAAGRGWWCLRQQVQVRAACLPSDSMKLHRSTSDG
jgi:transposase